MRTIDGSEEEYSRFGGLALNGNIGGSQPSKYSEVGISMTGIEAESRTFILMNFMDLGLSEYLKLSIPPSGTVQDRRSCERAPVVTGPGVKVFQ